MKKLTNAVFSVLNVLVIAGILLFIMAGLVHIGILEIPDFLKKLVGIETELSDGDKNDNPDFLKDSDSESNYEIYSASLTPENVKKILSELKPAEKYSHDVQYSVISDKSRLTKRAYVIKQNEALCAFYLSGDGIVEKMIVQNDDVTTVNTLSGNEVKSVLYHGDNIDFAAQTGVILTHNDFFDAADEPGYTFSIESDDIGTVMQIEFVSVNGEYSQLQKYTLSLDYGIVTEAYCYENDKLIYELTTNSLSKEITPSFVISEDFAKHLPDEFSEFKLSASVRTAELEPEVQE